MFPKTPTHIDFQGAIQFVTWCLRDAAPATAGGLQAMDDALDIGRGECLLRDPRIAAIVVETLQHFDGERYELFEWVVMPNHVHVLFTCKPGHSLGKVVGAWKGYSAHEINALLERTGPVWERGYFDRYMRTPRHVEIVRAYIHANPVRAGLVQDPTVWSPSSIAARQVAVG